MWMWRNNNSTVTLYSFYMDEMEQYSHVMRIGSPITICASVGTKFVGMPSPRTMFIWFCRYSNTIDGQLTNISTEVSIWLGMPSFCATKYSRAFPLRRASERNCVNRKSLEFSIGNCSNHLLRHSCAWALRYSSSNSSHPTKCSSGSHVLFARL